MASKNPIGKKLFEIRTRKGETQETVAEAVGINCVSLSRYETGQRMPKMDILSRLADHYKVTLDELIGRATNNEDDTENETARIREMLRRDPSYRLLFSAADKASPEHIRAAAAMLKALGPDEEG